MKKALNIINIVFKIGFSILLLLQAFIITYLFIWWNSTSTSDSQILIESKEIALEISKIYLTLFIIVWISVILILISLILEIILGIKKWKINFIDLFFNSKRKTNV
ncbi:hypothetical protein [Mesomycoplasma lagogenitalium]|uniref:Uncharacterized protein n=1 Tax=Mesomycoplasma lagogenitalium TaxID=171286 RepID=A0ABY8LTD2_9BACT|nr:hypothetical protein [Mesomycoplasma lagogenitalium]WGI36504.1 hypothetical protein QEG99_03500 [Mesomycoplasma lagogenitalium]